MKYSIKIAIHLLQAEGIVETTERKLELLEQMSKLRSNLYQGKIEREEAAKQLRDITTAFGELYESVAGAYDIPRLLAEMVEEDGVDLQQAGNMLDVLVAAYSRID